MSEGWSRETKVMDFLEKTICDELQTRQLRTEISSFLLEPAPKPPSVSQRESTKDKKTLLHILSSSSSAFHFF